MALSSSIKEKYLCQETLQKIKDQKIAILMLF